MADVHYLNIGVTIEDVLGAETHNYDGKVENFQAESVQRLHFPSLNSLVTLSAAQFGWSTITGVFVDTPDIITIRKGSDAANNTEDLIGPYLQRWPAGNGIDQVEIGNSGAAARVEIVLWGE